VKHASRFALKELLPSPKYDQHLQRINPNRKKEGKRPELTGGGLFRSLGGWPAVEDVLRRAEEEFAPRYQLQVSGIGLEELAGEVAILLEIEPQRIFAPGKYPHECTSPQFGLLLSGQKTGNTNNGLIKKDYRNTWQKNCGRKGR